MNGLTRHGEDYKLSEALKKVVLQNILVGEIKDDFDAKGYTVWEGFISRSHAQELRDLVLDMAKFERDAGDSARFGQRREADRTPPIRHDDLAR